MRIPLPLRSCIVLICLALATVDASAQSMTELEAERMGPPLGFPLEGEALVSVRLAGICATDLQIFNGYMGFTGQEIFLDLIFKGLRVVELPVKARGVREFGQSRISSSIPRYAVRSLQIMVRAFISYRPFVFLSAIASVFLALGLGLLVFLATHYLSSGSFSPHIWSGFVGGSFLLLGLSTLTLGIIGEVLVRIRMNQERILYFLKRSSWERARRGVDRSEGEPS